MFLEGKKYGSFLLTSEKWGGSLREFRFYFVPPPCYASPRRFFVFFSFFFVVVVKNVVTREVMTELMRLWDELSCCSTGQDRVVVLAATNRPWDLDPAVQVREQFRLFVRFLFLPHEFSCPVRAMFCFRFLSDFCRFPVPVPVCFLCVFLFLCLRPPPPPFSPWPRSGRTRKHIVSFDAVIRM